MKGFSAAAVLLLTGLVLVILALGIVYLLPAFYPSHQPTSAISSDSGHPNMKTTDLAPGLPADKKTAIVVMHSDSSYEKIIVATGTVGTYIKSLPEGDRVISQTSPAH